MAPRVCHGRLRPSPAMRDAPETSERLWPRPYSPTSKRGFLRARMETSIDLRRSIHPRPASGVLRPARRFPDRARLSISPSSQTGSLTRAARCRRGVHLHARWRKSDGGGGMRGQCRRRDLSRSRRSNDTALKVAGLFNSTIRGVVDITHLWTDPILLDGREYAGRFGKVPQTPYETGVRETLDWLRVNPNLKLQG